MEDFNTHKLLVEEYTAKFDVKPSEVQKSQQTQRIINYEQLLTN